MNNQILLEQIALKVQACKACNLYKFATHGVPGEGNPNAKIFLIGEGPGFYEDQSGRPFVGRAGQLLEKTLLKLSIKREDVFIGNVVKHRPPENRDPMPEEINACRPWLDQQLAIIKPKIIVTLGRFSMAKFLPGEKISYCHGQAKKVRDFIVIPMYHPAAALRNTNLLREFEQDFLRNKDLLVNPENVDQFEDPKADENQIKLF